MPLSKIRNGTLQFWPRKRAEKILPSANWKALENKLELQHKTGILKEKKNVGLNGFIGYKVSMASAFVKDSTPDSMVKNKKITIPVTIIECPKMKIHSVRFYKNGQVLKEQIVSWEKDLKAKIKKPGQIKKLEMPSDFDDIRVLIYSEVKNIGLKKSADLSEISLNGTKDEKIKYIQDKIGKEISISDVFKEGVVDVRGVTKAYGLQGPVPRFGISLKSHKSEKGVRRPGSLGPWHPAHVIFRTPMAGQLGFFSRVVYNNLIVKISNVKEMNINEIQKGGFPHYGFVQGDYIALKGSVQGTQKRPLLITTALRPTKKTTKQKYELIEFR